MVRITNKQGYLYIEGLDQYSKNSFKTALSIPNQMYKKMARMGKPVWYMKPFIEYFTEKNGVLIVGRGCRAGIIDYLIRKGIPYEEDSGLLSIKMTGPPQPPIKLREYQECVYDEINASEGVLKLGTGFGKSIIALDIARRRGEKTLIIVHRQHLFESYVNDIKKHYPTMEYGIIRGGELTIGDITIAMSQTLERMAKKKTLALIQRSFGMVIVDECHEFITKQRLKVIQSFSCCYFYGMSGTPERTDEQDKAIGFTFGKILSDHELPQIPPIITVIESNIKIPAREYHLMIEDMVGNEERNKMIGALGIMQCQLGRKTLILVKRVEHLRILEKIFADVSGFIPIYAKLKAKEKSALFSELRSGEKEFTILAGTYALLGTGSDIPSLDCLIFAGDLRSRVLSKQSIGRIMRLFKGKQNPRVIDIHDNLNPILTRQFEERQRLYNKLGWEIIK